MYILLPRTITDPTNVGVKLLAGNEWSDGRNLFTGVGDEPMVTVADRPCTESTNRSSEVNFHDPFLGRESTIDWPQRMATPDWTTAGSTSSVTVQP